MEGKRARSSTFDVGAAGDASSQAGLFHVLKEAAKEPFLSVAAAFRRDADAPDRLTGAIQGSCYLDTCVGIIMVCLLHWGGIDEFPCAPRKASRVISRGEWVRYVSYILYGLIGLVAVHLRRKAPEGSFGLTWAACMFFYLFLINVYIALWSVAVMGFGFTLVHRRAACAAEFNIIFASSFSVFTFLLAFLHGTMCCALSLFMFRCGGCRDRRRQHRAASTSSAMSQMPIEQPSAQLIRESVDYGSV